MKSLIVLTFSLVALMTGVASAQTEISQGTGNASLLLGYAKPHDIDSRLGYGAEVGMQMPNNWGGFVYYLGSSADQKGVKTDISHYGIGGDYGLPQMMNLRLGLRLGAASQTSKDSVFSWGVHGSWDYRLASNFSLGVEPILMFDTGNNSGTTIYVMGAGRFWF